MGPRLDMALRRTSSRPFHLPRTYITPPKPPIVVRLLPSSSSFTSAASSSSSSLSPSARLANQSLPITSFRLHHRPLPPSISAHRQLRLTTHVRAMSSKLIPADPAKVMVIRNVTPNVVTFSVPFLRFGAVKVGGRGTLVKLTSGALAVFSPVALTEDAKAKVTEMGGNVAYIVALDIEHHIFVSEWAKEYPSAKIVGPNGLPEKRAKQQDPKVGGEKFSTVFKPEGKRDTHIGDDFDADFDYEYFDGHPSGELAFNYRPDRVLIEADLLFNLPATEQYSKTPEGAAQPKFLGRIFEGLQNPHGGDNKWTKRFLWYAVKDRASFNDSVQILDKWDFTTIIPCHGDVIEGTGKDIFRKAFEWNLAGAKH